MPNKPKKDILSLKGKRVSEAVYDENCLTVTFEDGSVISAALRCGGGADGGWYTWTTICVKTPEEGSLEIIDR